MAMNFLYNTFVAPEPNASEEGKDDILQLKANLEAELQPSDRRATLHSLKTLAYEYKKLIGDNCLETLVNCLKRDKSDVSCIKPCLEIFLNLFTIEDPANSKDLGIVLSSRFSQIPNSIATLVECLEEKDFYVRYNLINIVQALYTATPSLVQSALLESPLAISRLVELLDEEREVLRNDGLLVLTELTKGNLELQKIIAFQNVFEKLLDIIQGEAGMDGGIVVLDCLELIINLVHNNPSNQSYFRESSCLHRLPESLSLLVEQEDPMDWENPQKVSNLYKLLQLIQILTQPFGTYTKLNQAVMGKCNLVAILTLLMGISVLPTFLKAQVLLVLGNILNDNRINQEIVGGATLISHHHPKPFLVHVVDLIFNSGDIRCSLAGIYLFQAYLSSNPDAQIALSSTLRLPTTHPSDPDYVASVGGLIIYSLTNDEDPWSGLLLLSRLLFDNPSCKSMALKIYLNTEKESMGLLSFIIKKFMTLTGDRPMGGALPQKTRRPAATYLAVIANWLYQSPASIVEFLRDGASFQYLIEIMQPGSDPLLQGITAFIICVIYQYNEESTSPVSRSIIRTLIIKRVGLESISNSLLQLRDLPEVTDARPWYQLLNINPQNYASQEEEEDKAKLTENLDRLLDHQFVEFFKSQSERMQQALIDENQSINNNSVAQVSEPPAVNPEKIQVALSEKDIEINELKARVRELEDQETIYIEEIQKIKLALEKADAYIQFLHSTRAENYQPISNLSLPPEETSAQCVTSSALPCVNDDNNINSVSKDVIEEIPQNLKEETILIKPEVQTTLPSLSDNHEQPETFKNEPANNPLMQLRTATEYSNNSDSDHSSPVGPPPSSIRPSKRTTAGGGRRIFHPDSLFDATPLDRAPSTTSIQSSQSEKHYPPPPQNLMVSSTPLPPLSAVGSTSTSPPPVPLNRINSPSNHLSSNNSSGTSTPKGGSVPQSHQTIFNI